MLSHPIVHPPHSSVQKFIQDYPSNLISRPKVTSFYTDYVNASPVDTLNEERIPSPISPQISGNYDYAPSNSNSFESQPSSAEIYRNPQNQPFAATNQYSNTRNSVQQSYNINTSAPARRSRAMNSYLSESPSPAHIHASVSALPHSIPPQSQERFPHSDPGPCLVAEDRASSGPERLSREQDFDKYPNDTFHNPLLDHRRMSEPAVLSAPNLYALTEPDASATNRYQHFNFAYSPPALHTSRSAASLYPSSSQRGAGTCSLRDVRDQHFDYPPQQSEWKHREPHESFDHQGDPLDEPVSPMQPNFSGGLGSSTTEVPYSPISDNLYGPSPPGTGTSTSSSGPLSAVPCSPSHSIPQHLQRSVSNSHGPGDSIDRKTYSFVALPGNAVKKRPRRRYDEIERLYRCSWQECNKSYGTLNHLNAHVTMQKHGMKRSPNEFKELRKQWRKTKKESDAARGIVHRDSYNDGYDDNGYHDHRYLNSHSIHHRPHSSHHSGLPSSVSIPHSGTTTRYSVSIDDIRYPAHDRDDGLISYGSLATRQRCTGGNLPSSWHGGSHIPSRPNIQQQYFSSSLPTQPAHYSQLPQLSINSRLHQPSSCTLPLNNLSYSGDAYEIYDDDSNSRPGTGHASIGAHSADEYDH